MNEIVTVEVLRSGRRFEAGAVPDLAAEARTVRETVSGCAALPRFMPGISACRVIARRPLEALK